jgi:hypothetical protein
MCASFSVLALCEAATITSSGGVSEKVLSEWFKAAGRDHATPDVKLLERLLDEHTGKLDVNATGADGLSALGFAAYNGHADVVEFLLKRGADVNKFSSKEPAMRPLWVAASNGHAKAVSALLAGGAKINEFTDHSRDWPTALHAAAYCDQAAMVRLLLERGADAGFRNKAGQTAADLAVKEEQDEVVAVFKEFAAPLASASAGDSKTSLLSAGASASSGAAGTSAAKTEVKVELKQETKAGVSDADAWAKAESTLSELSQEASEFWEVEEKVKAHLNNHIEVCTHRVTRALPVRVMQCYTTHRIEKKLAPIVFRLVKAQKVTNPFLAARFEAAQQRLKAAGRSGLLDSLLSVLCV